MEETSIPQRRKHAKDVRDSILADLNEEVVSGTPEQRYEIFCDRIGKVKARLMKYNDGNNQSVSRILSKIDFVFNKRVPTAQPRIVADQNKYRFEYDGSEADVNSYQTVLETVTDNIYVNFIKELKNVYYEAIGVLMQYEEDLYQREDWIGEIDVSKEEIL